MSKLSNLTTTDPVPPSGPSAGPSTPHPFKLAGHVGKAVEIDLLRIDPLYQRGLELGHVKRLEREWNELLCGNIVVVQRPGEDVYYVMDGQQRVQVTRQLGYTHIIAQVIELDDIEREAWLFTRFNEGGKQLSAMQKYRARLSWGEHVTKRAEEILNHHGLTGLATSQPNGITAVAMLREAWGPNVPLSAKWDAVQISDELLLAGAATLDWAIRAGHQLWVVSGDQANHTFSRVNLGALIWLRKNALNRRDLDAIAIGEVLADLGNGYQLTEKATDVSTSSGNSQGGDGTVLNGIRLADYINRQAGDRAGLVELSEKHRAELAEYHHKVEIAKKGTTRVILAA